MILTGGEVLTDTGWRRADIEIEGDSIVALGEGLHGPETVDVSGCLVGPAFVDVHTHLREPGQTWKEDIETGSRAAAAGGFAAVVAMPNTDPPMDTTKVTGLVRQRGDEVGLVDVVPSAALTMGRAGTEPTDMAALHRSGVRIFTDDGDCVTDAELLTRIMESAASLPGAVVAQHAETAGMNGHMHAGAAAARLGIPGIPEEAETEIVARDIELAAATGAHYHCQHVSSATTVALLETARRRGVHVTAEVTPHHLTFDEGEVETLGTRLKMYPPVRSGRDRRALADALRRGIIDIVATDHAPHTADEKAVSFPEAPRGVIGLETAASATWEALGDRNRLFEVLSTAPARLAGLESHGRPLAPGGPANLVVFDPKRTWTPRSFASRSSNSPYLGRTMLGKIQMTVHRGVVTFEGEV